MMKLKYNAWNEVSLRLYKKLKDLLESTELTDSEKDIKLVSLLTEEPEEKIELLPVLDIQGLVNKAGWIKSFSFDTKHCPKKLKLADRKFRVVMDITKVTTAQYLDFMNFYPKLTENYGKVLACFLIPVKAKGYGDGYDPLELSEFLEDHVSLPLANTLMFFFLKRLMTSIQITVAYFDFLLERRLKKDPKNPTLLEAKKKMAEQVNRVVPLFGRLG